MSLNSEQLEFFKDEGYLVVPSALDPAGLQPAIDEITSVIDEHSIKAVERGDLSQTYADEPFETRLWKIHQEWSDLYWSIGQPRSDFGGQVEGHGIFELIINDQLLDLAKSIVGPEIIGSAVFRLRPKLPGHWHGEVPWHQDSGYFEPTCDEELILTVWVPFVDATVERGCLEVMPGVHNGGVARHRQLEPGGGYGAKAGSERGRPRGYLEIADDDLPGDRILSLPVDRGGVVLLTNRTPHRSTPNRSNVVRWSIDIRYQSADLPTNFLPLAQERNHDINGNEANGSPEEEHLLACYPPEADFLVRSRAMPQHVVRTFDEFETLRRSHRSQPAQSTVRW